MCFVKIKMFFYVVTKIYYNYVNYSGLAKEIKRIYLRVTHVLANDKDKPLVYSAKDSG